MHRTSEAFNLKISHFAEKLRLQFSFDRRQFFFEIYFNLIWLICSQRLLDLISYRPARDFNDDLDSLLKGVTEFDVGATYLFSEILPHGSLAFPIGTTAEGRPFLAGAYYGLGRVLVISHESGLRNQVQLILKITQNNH